MKTYLLKMSVSSLLFLALVPIAQARKYEILRPPTQGKKVENLRVTDPALWKALENNSNKTNKPANANDLRLSVVNDQNPVDSQKSKEALETLADFSGVKNGEKTAVTEFMQGNSSSDVYITNELVSMSKALEGHHPDGHTARSVKNSLQYVGHLKGTKESADSNSITTNVLRAVANHINKVASWATGPKAKYRQFMRVYNSAKLDSVSQKQALRQAIVETFGLTGKAVEAKEREILEYCRV